MMHRMCASTLCCPCTTDPSFWYATCHFLRAGEYSSNTGGYLDESEETHRGMIPSTLATTHSTGQNPPKTKHTSLQCTHPSRASQTLRNQRIVDSRVHNWLLFTSTSVFPLYITNVLHCRNQTTPRYARYRKKISPWRSAVRQKHSPRSPFFKRSPARSNFRFSTQLFQIQSSLWLSGWLAAPPKQSPHCLELVVLPVCLSPLK